MDSSQEVEVLPELGRRDGSDPQGAPQGGPLSPLLANVLLDEVDRALEKSGHAFARYADDFNVYVRSKRAGARTAHPRLASSGDARRDIAQIAAITPRELTQSADTVLYAELLDLNCDGVLDYVAQVVRSSSGSSEGGLVLVAFHKIAEQWRQVLVAPSPVDGLEMIVLAADLNSDHHLDLVTWGSDEGGYVPRVFRSTADGYQAVRVPEMYTLRFEESWSAECKARVLPALSGTNGLRLSRETISPSGVEGHGPDCNLPRDSLALRADSLIRLSP